MQPNTRRVALVLAGLCVVAFVGARWITADVSPLRPDTASYLYFDPSRPIGYPFFLWIAGLFGGAALAVPLQMLLLCASLFLLGLAFFRWTRSLVLSVILQLALLASPEMWKFAAMLITEAVATATVALWCAQLLRTVQAPTKRAFAVLTVLSGLAMLVKPALLPLFLGTAISVAILPSWGERGKVLAIVAAGLAATLAATPVANFLLHGSGTSASPVARGVLQHTLFCPMPGVPADADSAWVDSQARPVINYISTAPAAVQPALKRIYTGKLRFGLIIPVLGRRHGMDESWQTDGLVWRITKERVSANPGCYAASVLGSYAAMSTYRANSPADSKRLASFTASNPPVELAVVAPLPGDERIARLAAKELGREEVRLAGRQDFEPPSGRPPPLIWTARLLYGSTAILGLLALVLLPASGRWSPQHRKLITCVAALGVVFHGIFGLTALVELALVRYTVPLWPVVCTLLGLVGAFILGRVMEPLRQGRNADLRASLSTQ